MISGDVESSTAAFRLDDLEQLLARAGITDAVGLPDSLSAPLLARLSARGVRCIPVTREGEAFAIAAGLWLGGRNAVVITQNTGLLESGDALRGTATRMGVPLVAIVTHRGYSSLRKHGLDPTTLSRERSALVRADLDTAALFTEATLSAWGIPYCRCDSAASLANAAALVERAQREERPVALLLTRPLV
jgi:hypothetical protein